MEITDTTLIILGAVLALVIVVLLGMAISRWRRSKRLQDRFGPEYEYVVNEAGNRRRAETELEERIARASTLDIRPLDEHEVNRYSLEWQAIQRQFVDEPRGAVERADHLLREVMGALGYPVDDFEQRTADISVAYPDLVNDYREMHLIAARETNEELSTEDLRQAMVHGRALFVHLVRRDAKEEVNEEVTDEEKI
jgi:hypothetical protein